ncbi:MAG: peptidase M16 [Candidatus Marinimicrobia bacterium]|nr:peptidase M16 [Candidatus Neomarinimicrobiota bacterium]|tara:strand:- start:884 stop:2161 length:1278 start_codon:yes stop_codon:yes gene_type:complete
MPESFKHIKSSGGIEEYQLKSNGLKVLMLQDSSTPVATFMVTYHVGSRNEAIGYTGSTHLLEHLMFKGSRNYNKEKGTAIWDELQNIGAQINATTWNDRTNYFEVVPSQYLEKAISIEADRMRYSFLRDEDRQPEMTVVRNEYERGENSPFDVLDKNIWATAYQAHPYHHSTIGWRSDIENVSTERLKDFYNIYYWPNNATATVIGDFNVDSTLSLIEKYFGEHSKSEHEIPKVYTEEPQQEGPRRIVVKRTGQAGITAVAHKTPHGLHNDIHAIHLLGKILCDGKSSRLYQKIVDQGLATSLFMYDFPFKDNGLFITYAFLTPEVSNQKVEEIILDEYNDIINNGVDQEELNRAIAKTRATVAFSRDGSYAVASALNEAIAIGDWEFYTNFLDNIEAVSTENIQLAAKQYLVEDQSTVGWFIPK